MDLFNVIDEAVAIVRLPKGVHKQVKVYQRGGKLFIPHCGGFVRIVPNRFEDTYSTGYNGLRVIDIEGPGIVHNETKRTLEFKETT